MPGVKGASRGPVAVLAPDELAHLGDEALLKRYQLSRAPAAFELIVARYRPMVFRTCFRRLHKIHNAEDATQATFLALAQRPGIVRTSLVGYLHGLALSAVKQIQRTESRVRRSESEVARIGEIVRTLGRSMHSTTRSDLREEIDAALARLPGPLRQAVILCHLEGRTQREAAHLAGCTPVTMGWRTMKGITRLRSILVRQEVAVGTRPSRKCCPTQVATSNDRALRLGEPVCPHAIFADHHLLGWWAHTLTRAIEVRAHS